MLEMYWIFFGCGVLFALLTILVGDLLHLDQVPFLNPMVVVGGATIFGAAGVMFTKYTTFTAGLILFFSFFIALLVSVATYFLYVKRMRNAETSLGFSITELRGRIAEVNTTIPGRGYGEVVVNMGIGLTHQMAASFDGEILPQGTRVVVVEVKENTLFVSRLEMDS